MTDRSTWAEGDLATAGDIAEALSALYPEGWVTPEPATEDAA